MILVVDACHSAAGVQGEGFKPAPMGSRGLGQLAYDQGMRVLTSTQADDVALEFRSVEMGLLTYALTREAVERAAADFLPADRRITAAEWLAYGVERVPPLHAELEAQLAALGGRGPFAGDAQTRAVRYAPRPRRPAPRASRGLEARAVRIQQPALFDFARRRETVLAVTRDRGQEISKPRMGQGLTSSGSSARGCLHAPPRPRPHCSRARRPRRSRLSRPPAP